MNKRSPYPNEVGRIDSLRQRHREQIVGLPIVGLAKGGLVFRLFPIQRFETDQISPYDLCPVHFNAGMFHRQEGRP